MSCQIIKVSNGLSAEDGYHLYQDMVHYYKENTNEQIVLDFTSLELYTSAFLYNSIGKFILLYGEEVFNQTFSLSKTTNNELKSIIYQMMRRIRYVQLQSLHSKDKINLNYKNDIASTSVEKQKYMDTFDNTSDDTSKNQ